MLAIFQRADRKVAFGLALAMSFSGAARAEHLNPESDVVGIRTTMSIDEIKKSIQDQFGVTDLRVKAVKFGTSAYSRDIVLGFSSDIVSQSGKDANQARVDELAKATEAEHAAGCTSPLCRSVASGLVKDSLDVYVDPTPGSSGVLALVRHTEYPKDSDILLTVFLQALVDKFGEPSFADPNGFYYWADNGVNASSADWSGCTRIGDGVGNFPLQFSSLINGFGKNVMNGFGKNAIKLPACGMYAKVGLMRIVKPGDTKANYVTGFTMTLVNVRKSYDALGRFASEFSNAADKAAADKLSKDAQNKPKL